MTVVIMTLVAVSLTSRGLHRILDPHPRKVLAPDAIRELAADCIMTSLDCPKVREWESRQYAVPHTRQR